VQNDPVQNDSVQNYALQPLAIRGTSTPRSARSLPPPNAPSSEDVTAMITAVAALLLLVLLAAGITVTDAVRSAHWRVVAVERRQSWYEQAGDEPR